jgi:uncharacterized protein YciI
MAELHHMLFYDYVEDVLDKRAPHREGHLALIGEWKQSGRVVIAGALGDPPRGAAIAFKVDDPTEVERFVAADPYVAGGVVATWRIEPWMVV